MILSGFTKDVIEIVSPEAAKKLKPIVKVPMILALAVCGLTAGLSITFWKFLGELIESQEMGEMPFLVILLVIIAVGSAPIMLLLMNWA